MIAKFLKNQLLKVISIIKFLNFKFFFREFQLIVPVPDNNSLSSNQDTNKVLV